MSRKRKSNSKVQEIFNKGKKLVTKSFVAFFLFEQEKPNLTIIASKKIGNAVKRNRSRRRLKECLRLHPEQGILKNISLVLIARNETSIIKLSNINKDFINLISKFIKEGSS